MKSNSFIKFLLVFVLYILLPVCPVSAGVVLEQHNSAKGCAICHYRWLDVFYYEGKDTALVPFQKERLAASEKMCFSCHNGSVADSRLKVWRMGGHKVKVKPSAAIHVTKVLPLKNGEIVCATCHTAHGVSDETRFDQVIYLRMPDPNSELCKVCHVIEFYWKKSGGHPIDVTTIPFPDVLKRAGAKHGSKPNQVICESCHLAHGGTNEKLLALEMKDGIQGESFLCEACHGKKPKGKKTPGGNVSHPVNVLPIKAQIPKSWSKSIKTVRAKDGKLVCRTCHVTHRGVEGRPLLPKPMKHGVLCISCHTDKKWLSISRHNMELMDPEFKNAVGKTSAQTGMCSACHLIHNGFSPFLLAALPSKKMDPVTGMCLVCHSKNGPGKKDTILHQIHPAFLNPKKVDITTSLPLFKKDGHMLNPTGNVLDKGAITCATCHDVHVKDAKPPRGMDPPLGAGIAFLRDNGMKLCVDCHWDKRASLPVNKN